MACTRSAASSCASLAIPANSGTTVLVSGLRAPTTPMAAVLPGFFLRIISSRAGTASLACGPICSSALATYVTFHWSLPSSAFTSAGMAGFAPAPISAIASTANKAGHPSPASNTFVRSGTAWSPMAVSPAIAATGTGRCPSGTFGVSLGWPATAAAGQKRRCRLRGANGRRFGRCGVPLFDG